MILQAGKSYRTRSGHKAVVLCTDAPGPRPVIGFYVRQGFPGYSIRSWLLYGGMSEYPPDAEDLVGEWIDKPIVDWSAMPKWAKYVAMGSDGIWFHYHDRPVLHDGGNGGYYTYVHPGTEPGVTNGPIPKEFAPKWFGRWQDSLVERPQ